MGGRKSKQNLASRGTSPHNVGHKHTAFVIFCAFPYSLIFLSHSSILSVDRHFDSFHILLALTPSLPPYLSMAQVVSSHIQQSQKHVRPHFLRRHSLRKKEMKEGRTKNKDWNFVVAFLPPSFVPSLPPSSPPHLVIHSEADTRVVAFVLNY